MRLEWDSRKDRINRRKHGISFEEAAELLRGGEDFLEIYDEEHSAEEDRFIAVGRIRRGVVVVVYVERAEDLVRILSARMATKKERGHFDAHVRGKHA
jgi:uncharacterized DUF497 family protein